MNTKAKKTYDILNGPNRDLLFDACKYAYDKDVKVQVEFTIATGYTAPKESGKAAYVPMDVADFRIHTIGHEDGSGKSLLLKGFCKANTIPFGRGNYRAYVFDMYYDVRDRKGWIALA